MLRLRAAGVSFEDRKDLLGYRSGRMITHYSAAELTKLIEATEYTIEKWWPGADRFAKRIRTAQLPEGQESAAS